LIIGLLASYVGPKYFAQIGKSEVTVAKAQIEGLGKALDTYRLDLDAIPGLKKDLRAFARSGRPINANKWNGPYLNKDVPLDPWGHPYQYRNPGSPGRDDIISYGKDGQPGGSGENADITN